jgi:hypothetical protein
MKASRGTTGYQELEARRLTKAFDEISKSWWWFEEGAKLAHAANDAAWQWELLRRSNVYRKFHIKADAIRVQDKTDHSLAGFSDSASSWANLRALAGSISRLGDRDPCHKWPDLFHAQCVPSLCWTALPEKSLNVVASLCPLYPRAEIAAAFTPGIDLQVEGIIVKRLPSGHEELTPLTLISSVTLGRYQVAELLSAILPAKNAFGVYVVVIFDVRNAESTLTRFKEHGFLSGFTKALQNGVKQLGDYLKITNQTAPTPCMSSARVVGSNEPFWCQAWIPFDSETNTDDLLRRFRTLIGSRKRRQWLPECEKVWRELSPSFSSGSTTFLKAKRARINDKRDMQAGLCAYDCRQIETRFTQDGLLIKFLRKQADFQNLTDPYFLRNARLQIERLIKSIDKFYVASPVS